MNVLLQAATREAILRQSTPEPDVVLDGGAGVDVDSKYICAAV